MKLIMCGFFLAFFVATGLSQGHVWTVDIIVSAPDPVAAAATTRALEKEIGSLHNARLTKTNEEMRVIVQMWPIEIEGANAHAFAASEIFVERARCEPFPGGFIILGSSVNVIGGSDQITPFAQHVLEKMKELVNEPK